MTKQNTPILVTGATGNLGGALCELLEENKAPYRAAVRTVRDGAGPQHVALDFQKPETFGPALDGIKGLFLIRPPAISKVKTTLNPFLDVATNMGVKHVVFVSVSGAEDNKMVPHHGVEQHLLHGTLPYTILRPGFFAQNLGGPYRQDISEDHRLYLPTGAAQGSFIDTRDIAEVAYRILCAPEDHRGQGYTLTGQQLLSFDEIAALLTEALGRPIAYQRCSLWSYFWHLRRKHRLPWMQCLVQSILHTQFSRGGAAQIDPALPKLLGRPPRSMREYIQDHRHLWEAL